MTNNNIHSLEKIYSGKVRDLYAINSKTMLMVASDRLSTFDVILNQQIPHKGVYLTQISLFWFNYLKNIIQNHLTEIKLESVLSEDELKYALGRSLIVQKLKPIPIEVIIRGYLAGNAYKSYQNTGGVCGITLPKGLQNAQKLPHPIFTPSTKAAVGAHDENITILQCQNMIGVELTQQLMNIAITLYQNAHELAYTKGIIIADTKFEFGINENNELILMDEVLTPDSSRFWDVNNYVIGSNPHSFDKQYVRDYLEIECKWDKHSPIPNLPSLVIKNTIEKYTEIMKRLLDK